MLRRLGYGFSAVAVLAIVVPARTADINEAHINVITEATALPRLLAGPGPGPILLDCRTGKEYENAHIDSARRVDVSQLMNVSVGRSARGKQDWAAWFSAQGVDADRQVVIYDDGNMTDAARVWFLLQYGGIRQASVINGGFEAVKPLIESGSLRGAAGVRGQSADTRPSPPIIHGGASCQVALADKNTVRAAIDRRDTIILDVRTETEYKGTDTYNNPRHGRIPNAVNIPHTRMMQLFTVRTTTQPTGTGKAKGRLKSPQELRELFEKAGITKDHRVVAHCQSGGRAALAALALVWAGYGNVSNYYASFGEWSADPDLPIAGLSPATSQSRQK